MKMTRILSSTVLAITLLWANAANAEVYRFTVTGDYSATWQLNSDAFLDVYWSETGVTYHYVDGSFPESRWDRAIIHFRNTGGIVIYDNWDGSELLNGDGPQLFAKSEDSFEFVPGTYALTERSHPASYTLTILAVPEPATYGMMLAGLGLVGAVQRRRQVK